MTFLWFIHGGYILTTYVRPGVILQEGIGDPGEKNPEVKTRATSEVSSRMPGVQLMWSAHRGGGPEMKPPEMKNLREDLQPNLISIRGSTTNYVVHHKDLVTWENQP